MSSKNDSPNLIWVDCEMTGLDLNKDVLVEIAVLVTDSELNILGEGVDLVIRVFIRDQKINTAPISTIKLSIIYYI